jgi:hypothetical protein
MRSAASEKLSTSSVKEFYETQMKKLLSGLVTWLLSLHDGIDIFVVLRHWGLCLSFMATRHLRLNKIISSGSLTISSGVFVTLSVWVLT